VFSQIIQPHSKRSTNYDNCSARMRIELDSLQAHLL
jgi:hypothetical protein